MKNSKGSKSFLHVVESIKVRDKNYEVVVGLEAKPEERKVPLKEATY